MKSNILFVCIENSCRSQMAEAFARQLGGDAVQIRSAGSKPSGKVNETAVQVMLEKGIDMRQNWSKGFHDLPVVFWDTIVTLGCGDACPNVPGKTRLDWQIPDPKQMPLDDFRKVRDQIEAKVRELLKDI